MSSSRAAADLPGAVVARPRTEVEVVPGEIAVVPGEIGAQSGTADDVLAVPVGAGPDGPRLDAPEERLLAWYGTGLAAVRALERVTGAVGEVVRAPITPEPGRPPRLLLVGVGGGTPRELRRAAAALARSVRGRRALFTTLGSRVGAEGTRAVVEGLVLGGYQPPAAGVRRRTDSDPVGRAVLLGGHRPGPARSGALHARAGALARDLAETPSSEKNPAWFAGRARELGEAEGLSVRVWEPDDLAADGFGGLLAVGGASATPPRLVRLDYLPPGREVVQPGRRRRPVVLVGKGVTFDTGGLSIKPRESMVPMKTDMSGAAAVLAVLLACREAGVRRPVTGLLPLAENAVGASAYRPGDVLRVYGGRTVEILNTDAEGRIVLADALGYAVAELDPAAVVDLATLTGAATLGLGRRHAALFATDDRLARGLAEAAEACGEQVWRLPLAEDYRPALDSAIADLRHVPGVPGPGGGAITAALFLREFAGGRPWAHLDIAGTARSDRDEYEITRGATGYGARLLLRWLEELR